MRSVAPALALLAVVATVAGCRLLALGVACERDENCRDDERCVEGLCVRQVGLGSDDGGPGVDGGALPLCPSPGDPKREPLVLEEPLVIDTPDELAALEDVVVIEGDLRVTPGAGLTAVDLPSLVEVTGSLRLDAPVEGFEPFDASLPCLARVGGELVLDGDAAATFELPRLTAVEGSLTLTRGYASVPLPDLRTVGGELVVDQLAIADLGGLTSLRELGGLAVTGNQALTSLAGLEGLASLPGALSVRQNPALTSLDGLAGLTALGGPLTVEANPALPTCEAEALRDRLVDGGYRGAVLVAGNDDDAACAWHTREECPPVLAPITCPADADDLNLLTDDDVANAQAITCAANVVIAPTVTSVCLPALVEVSGGLTLGDGNTATHVELPALRKAGALYGSGASLVALSLPRLETVGGVELFNLPLLERVYLPALRTVIGSLRLQDATTTLLYLPQLFEIVGELRVERVTGPTDVYLPSLDDLEGVLRLRENPSLTNVSGLGALRQAGGLDVTQNPALLDFDGIGLDALFADVTIEQNAALRSIGGIDPTLTFSGNVVNVRDNPCLPEDDALAWAEAVSPGAHNVSGNGTGECP